MEEQTQLALESSDALEVSSAQFEGNEVLVEDWVSDTCSESVELPTEWGLLPLVVDIPMEGGLYTWFNTSSASRLNRFLFSPLLAVPFTLFA